MSILSGITDALGALDTAIDLSVTACEFVGDVWVCQTSSSQSPEIMEGSAPVDMLSLDERLFLSEFFLPIADALSDDLAEAWVVPSQYDPSQATSFYEDDDIYHPLFGYESSGGVGFDDAEYYGYSEYEPVVMQLHPRLVKKWRRVPCNHQHQHYSTDVLFINNGDMVPLAEGCGMFSTVLLLPMIVLFCWIGIFCCMARTIKSKLSRNKFSKDKTQPLLAPTGEVGSYVPQSFTIAVKKKPEKMGEEPHIIFI